MPSMAVCQLQCTVLHLCSVAVVVLHSNVSLQAVHRLLCEAYGEPLRAVENLQERCEVPGTQSKGGGSATVCVLAP